LLKKETIKCYRRSLTIIVLILMFGASDLTAQIRILRVDPSKDVVTIKNFGASTVDISSYRLCALFAYTTNLTSLVLESGSLSIDAGEKVVLSGFSLNDAASDFGLYLDGNFTASASMVDFAQWGSGGNGRESVAVSKGIWSAAEFITGLDPFTYNGDGTQNGLSFWEVSNPAVTTIEPTSAISGRTVTIFGAHFDPTPNNNTVIFGGVAATINSGTTGKLVVTVPSTMPGPIEVIVSNTNGSSNSIINFTIIASNQGGVFGPQQVISVLPEEPLSTFAADLDNDGDFDVLSGSFVNQKVAWYENTSGEGAFSVEQVISTNMGGVVNRFIALILIWMEILMSW